MVVGPKSKLLYIACKPVGISDDWSINSSPSNWILDGFVKKIIYKKIILIHNIFKKKITKLNYQPT
jgi:hypothetical protein